MRNLASCWALLWLAAVGHAEDFRQENTAENLKATMQRLRSLVHEKRNVDAADQLFTGLLPNKQQLRLALAEDVDEAIFEKCWTWHLQLAAAKPDLTRLCKPEQTEVKVYAATTEELADSKHGSAALEQFPGDARRLAERNVLRPGMTFYEVALTAPGAALGMKYHLFFWDGQQWKMAGPLWRVVRD